MMVEHKDQAPHTDKRHWQAIFLYDLHRNLIHAFIGNWKNLAFFYLIGSGMFLPSTPRLNGSQQAWGIHVGK
jgi:hypothetical protein